MNYFMVMVWTACWSISSHHLPVVVVDLCSKFDFMHLVVYVLLLVTEDLELYFISSKLLISHLYSTYRLLVASLIKHTQYHRIQPRRG